MAPKRKLLICQMTIILIGTEMYNIAPKEIRNLVMTGSAEP